MAKPGTAVVGEDELTPISALLHMLYCPRRCALIHIERQWSENRFTAEGRILGHAAWSVNGLHKPLKTEFRPCAGI